MRGTGRFLLPRLGDADDGGRPAAGSAAPAHLARPSGDPEPCPPPPSRTPCGGPSRRSWASSSSSSSAAAVMGPRRLAYGDGLRSWTSSWGSRLPVVDQGGDQVVMPMAAGEGLAWTVFTWAMIALLPRCVMPWIAGPPGPPGRPILGPTAEHRQAVRVENSFHENLRDALTVTFGLVTVSLRPTRSRGTGRRGPARPLPSRSPASPIFRASPPSVPAAGHLPVFIDPAGILRRILAKNAPTPQGQPLAVPAVLVSIDQPFTIWMLRGVFQDIPVDLGGSAPIDGCSHFRAFRRVGFRSFGWASSRRGCSRSSWPMTTGSSPRSYATRQTRP